MKTIIFQVGKASN